MGKILDLFFEAVPAGPHSYEYDEQSTKELCQKIAKGLFKAQIDENGVLWLNDGTQSLGYGTWVRADKA